MKEGLRGKGMKEIHGKCPKNLLNASSYMPTLPPPYYLGHRWYDWSSNLDHRADGAKNWKQPKCWMTAKLLNQPWSAFFYITATILFKTMAISVTIFCKDTSSKLINDLTPYFCFLPSNAIFFKKSMNCALLFYVLVLRLLVLH